MSNKIYTKTGDQGETSLIGGTRVSKADLRIEAYGTVDELNAHLGLCRDLVADPDSKKLILEIQNHLFVIGALLATTPEKPVKMSLPAIREQDCQSLEKAIDRMEASLESLRSFILPGGHATISAIHIARCVSRRAERCVVRLAAAETVAPLVLIYLNRLSDLLFVLSRYTGRQLGIADIPWQPDLQA